MKTNRKTPIARRKEPDKSGGCHRRLFYAEAMMGKSGSEGGRPPSAIRKPGRETIVSAAGPRASDSGKALSCKLAGMRKSRVLKG